MNFNGLFKSYKNKLRGENFLKALLFALTIGAISVFIITAVYHIMIKETPIILTSIIGIGCFVVSFVLFYIVNYPTKKKVAGRIDDIGLKDRVSTMYEYRDNKSEIAQMQRSDAIRTLNSVSSKQMKIKIKKREWISCLLCLAVAVGAIFIPYNIFDFSASAEETNAEQEAIVRELIEKLRNQVEQAELDDELKDELNDIIDDLEERLKDADTELERAAQVEKSKREMEALLEKAISKRKIGEALQKYDLTRALGEAISKGDTEKVSSALDDLEKILNEDKTTVKNLSNNIDAALIESGVEDTDELYTALNDFASELFDIDTEASDFSENLAKSVDKAEEAINAALEKQAAIEKQLEEMEEAMSDAKDDLLGNEDEEKEKGDKPEGETTDGEKPDGEKPDGEMPDGEKPDGDMPDGDMPSGEGGEGDEGGLDGMTESFYDPISGNVAFGEVYAAYYAEYLKALENGTVPDGLEEIIDNYFTELN